MNENDKLEQQPDDQPTIDIEAEVLGKQIAIGEPSADEPTVTITLDDLFSEDNPVVNDEEDTLPPRPVMTTQQLPDDDNTPSAPPPPIIINPPQRNPATLRPASDTPKSDSPTSPRPRFNPPPTARDTQATVVNPRTALPRRDPSAAKVEEIRRRRARQRGQEPRQTEEQPTRVSTRQTRRELPPEATIVAPPLPEEPVTPKRVVIPPTKKKKRSTLGCLINGFVITFLVLLFGFILSVAGLAIGYVSIAGDLPSVTELRDRASQFETIFIYDANGDLLYSVADPNEGNRTYVPLSQIDQDLINATIATEDADYWTNPGFAPRAIARAAYTVIFSGAFADGDITAAGGASTITQQLVRATLLDEDERGTQSVRRKLREIILAAELSRVESKETILELYLNQIYYGNRAYGIEAAARTYFRKSAANLTLAEATLLAGLPQAPALWDPISAPDYATGRQSEVLYLTSRAGHITTAEAQSALNEGIAYTIEPPSVNIRYPHFTLGVLQQLENIYGSQAIYGAGFRVYTTIQPEIQNLAEQTLAAQRGNIQGWGGNNASIVVLDAQSAEILALIGSLDYRDEAISGQINMARVPRQPGSTIKPFVYLAGMERGYTPATLFWDVETAFPDGANPAYVPKNYDNDFHGPMLLRTALANSYNIPAVKALEFVGVCSFIERANTWGLTLTDDGCAENGTPRNFGLALSLGGGEITPLQMAGAYGMLANGGKVQRPASIQRIVDKNGQTVFSNGQPVGDTTVQEVDTVGISAEHAYLLSNILSDNNARVPEFTLNNLLNIPGHNVAAKTGTSGTSGIDVRDAWTIGYSAEIVAAVWVGNTSNAPLAEGASGYRVASPIWNQFMTGYLANRQPINFSRPASVIEQNICADSGVAVTPTCPNRKTELFNINQLPLPSSNHFVRSITIDRWTLRRVTEFCNDEEQFSVSNFNLFVGGNTPEMQQRYAQSVVNWLGGSGRWWANQNNVTFPIQDTTQLFAGCEAGTQRPRALIQQPSQNETLTQPLIQIGGVANAPGFAGYQLEYGYGTDPTQWFPIGGIEPNTQTGGRLGVWDTTAVPESGIITLRLLVFGPDNPYTGNVVDRPRKEARVIVNLIKPTAVPQPTDTPTQTPTNTPIIVTPTPIIVTPTQTPINATPTPIVVEPTPVVVTQAPILASPTPIISTPTEPPVIIVPTNTSVIVPVTPTETPTIAPPATRDVEPTAYPSVDE